ncbi:2-oxo acid dehydrogenase subunit E2 [Cryobacterium tepidiphilum]|uniref:Dihydrolipoamide acetyltransferase component of pyruvate dehydrogenase complex n=1 Tax=Cryobacterium tepidiphilum TaxID=2486026 RepID=A0A3M8LC45_9MICO|nr:2-oxo acid dehydrogenase subunit E2 [Cryobacterium tepidiphilum]RNE62352.1 dihydrolipoamide succinyltransferase [Cryobacterium tepidiphilum]
MSESVSLPALGESVTEGTVTRWLKNVGDRVEVDEPLLEVSTDKVDTEIPSPVSGVIEAILVQEDETVDVGTVLVTIGDGSGAAAPEAPAQEEPAEQVPAQDEPAEQAPAPEAAAPAAPAEPAPQEKPAEETPSAPAESPAKAAADAGPSYAAPAPSEEAPKAAAPAASSQPTPPAAPEAAAGTSGYVTPIVRKLANEAGVDLSTVTGTGVGGRIRKQDIEAAKGRPGAASAAPTVAVSPLRGTSQPMSRLRKVVAESAATSMQTSAQSTTVIEVDVTRVAQLRDAVQQKFQASTGTKLSFLPFFALAAAEALQAYPIINATIEGDAIVYPAHENISIAVDTERGLLTPVVRDASALDLAGLAKHIADLADRTRQNKLTPDELTGGTFTVTNTGSRGALFDTPVVFLPQSAVLGTGIVCKKPVVVTHDDVDAIAIRSTVYLALSYDQRIIDGADAARFLTAVKERLESGAFEGNLGI